MGTSWASLVTDDALLIINDLRLNTELSENPALFYRKMALYVKNAVPRFNRPPEIRDWLAYTEPTYNSLTYTVDGDQTADFTIDSGLTGYDLMSAGVMTEDVYGNPVYTAVDIAAYDADSGEITVTATSDNPVADGTVLSFDFYTDGTFDNDLTDAQRHILAMCIQECWEKAFTNEWLNRAPRASDRSFNAGNVQGQVRANTERMNAIKRTLDDEIFAYAQNCAYDQTVTNPGAVTLY